MAFSMDRNSLHIRPDTLEKSRISKYDNIFTKKIVQADSTFMHPRYKDQWPASAIVMPQQDEAKALWHALRQDEVVEISE